MIISRSVTVFGNNWVFYVPTTGEDAGKIMPFGYGPPKCEVTGPTFIDDTLIVAVQHPGEDVPINDGTAASVLNRDIEMLDLDSQLFIQNRTVPRGSNWPSNINILGSPLGPPRPTTVGIRRKTEWE